MKAVEKYKKKISDGSLGKFPHRHLAAVSALGLFLVGITILPSEKADAKRHSQIIDIPEQAFISETKDTPFNEKALPSVSSNLKKHVEKVKSGDTLSRIFQRAGLNDRHMMTLLNSNKEAKRLANLYPGHSIEFFIDQNQSLARLNYIQSKLEGFSLVKTESGFDYQTTNREPDIHFAATSGKIKNSLYDAGISARLDDKLIMELADIFGWDIDFALDIRKGDSFYVLYEEKFLDGEKIGNGNILAAEFINQNETFRAVRYTNKNGDVSYYTPEGKSMRKAFLRAPLDFRRISSNFNPNRLHPIFKTRRPHRGIDYAASRGTPVWASGNGRVIASAYSKANGNYVVIQHGNNIQTKYLHLHKRAVKKGQKVKQKQKIGTVGSTGYSTAPHLHYEFLISGVHRNPRTIINKLPKAKSIDKSELARFEQQIEPIVAELNKYSAFQYVQLDTNQ